MRDYRRLETARPMANCEVIELDADALSTGRPLAAAPGD
jgi:hypothetical protein